jgi:hypothetical protein
MRGTLISRKSVDCSEEVPDFLKINSQAWEAYLTSREVCRQATTNSNWIADATANRRLRLPISGHAVTTRTAARRLGTPRRKLLD